MTIIQATNTELSIWEDKEKLPEIRKLFAPKLSDLEFQYFVGLGKATNLNPFLREIWSIKYQEGQPAQVFIGRDGYRKAAQAHFDYDYHQCDAVYENDKFEVVNAEVKHSYNMANRGKLVGAYCIAKRHKSSRPMYVFVDIAEYSTGRSVWKDKPATMLKKVAESQCLRAAFQDLLGGTYGEEEMDRARQEEPKVIQDGVVYSSRTEQLKGILSTNNAQGVIDEEIINDFGKEDSYYHSNSRNKVYDNAPNIQTEESPGTQRLSQDGLPDNGAQRQSSTTEKATQGQLDEIGSLLFFKDYDDERKSKAFTYFGITDLSGLTQDKAQRFIALLNKS